MVASNLLLHQTLILLQVSQSLLQVQILLSLVSDRLVVNLAHMLQSGHQVSHIVGVEGVQLVSHRFDLSTVHLNLLLVIFQLLVSLTQQSSQVLNIQPHRVSIGRGRSVGSASLTEIT